MNYQTYVPRPPLSELVEWFWFYDDLVPDHSLERVLPHGAMELIIDLKPEPKRLFDRENLSRSRSFRGSWLSGVHSRFIVIEARPDSSMMGVHFKPGGAYPFLGFPAAELRDAVVELEQIFGTAAIELRDRLLEAPAPAQKFRVLEAFLLRRARIPAAAPRAAAFALRELEAGPATRPVRDLAARAGVSHKHLIDEFARWVGLTPKTFCRIRRFQSVLRQVQVRRAVVWADVACSCGYFDQAHFIHDFQAFSGLNPSAYLTDCASDHPNFVPIRPSPRAGG